MKLISKFTKMRWRNEAAQNDWQQEEWNSGWGTAPGNHQGFQTIRDDCLLYDLRVCGTKKRIDESEFYFYDNIENNLHEFEEIKKWINEVPCKLYFLLDAQRGALTIRHNMEQKLIVKKIEDVLKNYNYRIVKDFNY